MTIEEEVAVMRAENASNGDSHHTMPNLTNHRSRPDYRTFSLAGDHYACGFAMGQQTQLRAIPDWEGRPHDVAFARACSDVVGEQHALLLDEFRGYADGGRRPWEDVLPHFSLNHPAGVVGGCSTLIWRVDDGGVMVARNYDFTRNQVARHLIRSAPPEVESIVGTNASLIGGRYDGVNAAGLFVALHLVRANGPRQVGPGLPFHLVPRVLLETCTTARGALERLLSMPLLHAFNYALADDGEFFAVEVYPGTKCVRAGDGALVTTNHYQHPDMVKYQGRRRSANSRRRAERLCELWRMRRGTPWQWAQTILADHVGPMCNHDRHLSTLWSLVADLSNRRIAYCMGAPCQEPYREMSWPDRG